MLSPWKAFAFVLPFAALVSSSVGAPSPQQIALLSQNLPGSADHPLVGRYKDSVILAQTQKAFDELVLPNGPSQGKTYASDKKFSSAIAAQGRVSRIIYIAPQGRSSLEVMTNFLDSSRANGFEPIFGCVGEQCGESFPLLKYRWDKPETKVLGANYDQNRKLMIDAVFDQLVEMRYALLKKSGADGDSYVAIYGGLHRGGSFGDFSAALQDRVGVLIEVVEPRAMERRMEVVSASEIGGKVANEGKAIFYGILFDFDKTDIKAESEPQLAEMAKFLKENAQLRVFVTGHTDNKGALDYNVGLSGRRADSVVKALVTRFGINAARLTARGLGPLAPVASNRSEEGRARNRRVELVEQ